MSASQLAINGGIPVRDSFLPYSRQTISEADRHAVAEVLDSDFLTTGPEVALFEEKLGSVSGGVHAAAVSNGTAALHCMLDAYRIGPGDEVIVPAITFVATSNAVLYLGGTPVFADVEASTLLIDPKSVERNITNRTKAVIAVDFAGQAADYDSLRQVLPRQAHMLADASHSIGASQDGVMAGALADASTFSFHPVKPVAAGEGGAVLSPDPEIIESVKSFRNHGIDLDHAARAVGNTWKYDAVRLGYNYRLSDIHSALASSQLDSMEQRRSVRERIAARYDEALKDIPGITPLELRHGAVSAHHLYVVKIENEQFHQGRDEQFVALKAENIGVNVHYIPVPNHPLYKQLGAKGGPWPVATAAYEQMLSLPLWAGMSNADADDVIEALQKVSTAYRI